MTSYNSKKSSDAPKKGPNSPIWCGGTNSKFFEAEADIQARHVTHGYLDFLDGTLTHEYQGEKPTFGYYVQLDQTQAETVVQATPPPPTVTNPQFVIRTRTQVAREAIAQRQRDIDADAAAAAITGGIPVVIPPGTYDLTPQAEQYPKSLIPVKAGNIAIYYEYLAKYKAELSTWERSRQAHLDRYSKAMILFETCFSQVIYKAFRPITFNKGMAEAWVHICAKYRPASDQEGLQVLHKEWTSLRKNKGESLEDFLSRLDTLALNFEGYNHPKADVEKINAVTSGLLTDPDWAKYEIITDATDERGRSYEEHVSQLIHKSNKMAAARLELSTAADEQFTQVKSNSKKKGLKSQSNAAIAETTPIHPTFPVTPERANDATSAPGSCFHCWGPHMKNACPLYQSLQNSRNYYWATTGKTTRDSTTAKETHNKKQSNIAIANANRFSELGNGEDSTYESNMIISTDNEQVINSNSTILDSGSTHNMMNSHQRELTNYKETLGSVTVGNKAEVELVGKGTWGILKDVLHVPGLQHSMVSVPALDLDGKFIVFGNCKCLITDKEPTIHGSIILEAPLSTKRLYEVPASALPIQYASNKELTKTSEQHLPECTVVETTEREQIADPSEPAKANDKAWVKGSRGYNRSGSTAGYNKLMKLHLRTNHCSKKKLLWMLKNNSIKGTGLTYQEALLLDMGTCEACEMGNMRAAPIPSSTTAHHHDKEPFHKISSDPVPMGHKSLSGNTIMIIFVDYSTGFIAAYYAKNRTRIEDYIEQLKFDVIDRYGHTCHEIVTDCDKVFVSEDFEIACQVMGIHTSLATPYLHRPNYSETAVNIIVGMIRVLLIQSKLPNAFWELAAKYAIYHANRTIKSQQSKTPWELVTSEVPDASLWRPFGAKCYCHQTKDETVLKGGKIVAKGQKGVLVGYSEKVAGGYEVYLGKKAIITRRHVLVVECKPDLIITPYQEVNKQNIVVEEPEIDRALSIATRARAMAKAVAQIPNNPHNTRSKGQIAHDKRIEVMNNELASEPPSIPTSINEAINSVECLRWITAIDAEVAVYVNKQSLKPIEALPLGHKAMSLKVCFKKTKDQKNRVKYKVRITPRGFTQVKDRDYGETYAPTLSRNSMFLIIEYAVIMGWEVNGFDISYAYLQAEPERRLFVTVTQELIDLGLSTTKYNELMTNMYGLKQGGRVYADLSNKKMLAGGLTRCISDPCVYYRHDKEGNTLIVMVFVDDIIITGHLPQQIKDFSDYLTSTFQDIKSFGAIDRYLGLTFDRNEAEHTVNISQEDYADSIVEKFLQPTDRGLKTPMTMNTDLRLIPAGDCEPIWDIVGSVRYLADNTRPDLQVATSILGQFQAKPAIEHVQAAKHLVQFIKETSHYTKTLGGKSYSPRFEVDASFETTGDSMSRYGMAFYVGDYGATYTRCKKISRVVHHPPEAEAIGIVETIKEAIWVSEFSEELKFPFNKPIPIFTDSQATIDTTRDVGMFAKTKYYNKDLNFIREKINDGTISLVKISREDNSSDLMTNKRNKEETLLHGNKLMGKKDLTI